MRFSLPTSSLVRKLLAFVLAALLLPAAAAPRVLKYTDHEPLGGMRTRFLKDVLFAAIEKESNGRLKIEDHWDNELAGGYDALRAVGEGRAADLGIVVPEYVANDLPLHQIFKSFPSGPTGDRQVAFFRRVYTEVPAFAQELKNKNLIPVFLATGYPVAFFGSKSLPSLDGIKGGTWRSASFWHQDFLRNSGAKAITMPWGPAVIAAVKSHELDGVMVNVDSGYMLKVQAYAPNVLISKDLWLGHVYLLVMNLDTWNSLAAEDRQAIERAGQMAYRVLGAVMDRSYDAIVSDLEKDGAHVRALNPEAVRNWSAGTRYQEVQTKWVKEREGEGLTSAGGVLEKVRAIWTDAMK